MDASRRPGTRAATSQLKSYTTEQVVWRDAATGRELAGSDQFSKMSPGILVTPGFGGLQYFLSLNGEIRSLQVAPTPAEPAASPAPSVAPVPEASPAG